MGFANLQQENKDKTGDKINSLPEYNEYVKRAILVNEGFEKFALMTDEQIVEIAQTDAVALEYVLHKYKNFVRKKARSYFLIGADKEDIVQEGMIGLYKAIRDYNIEKKASFRAFAELCITRQIITAIKTATRLKHQPLNSYISLNKPIYDEESERTMVDMLVATKMSNPEEIIIDNEDFLNIEKEIAQMLSDLEKRVLAYYLQGKSYQEIAKAMAKITKNLVETLALEIR
ncbi:MAG: RNA polymerase sporulation sigma factor SigH [Christensenellaceae bacterium]